MELTKINTKELRTTGNKERNYNWEKWKIFRKMVSLHQNISINTLNINALNTQYKGRYY